MKRCALYWHYDHLGVLLYIGISERLVTRGKQHAADSDWVKYAETVKAKWFDDRLTAARCEELAVRQHRPIFNRQYNEGPESEARRSAYIASRAKLVEIDPISFVDTCRECAFIGIYELIAPADTQFEAARIVGSYECPEGHYWTRGYAIPGPDKRVVVSGRSR